MRLASILISNPMTAAYGVALAAVIITLYSIWSNYVRR